MQRKQYPEYMVSQIERWMEDTQDSRPWHHDPRVLVVVEQDDFCDVCLTYLVSRLGRIVTLDSRAAYTNVEVWKQAIQKSHGTVLFLREFNLLTSSKQQSLWASWLNNKRPSHSPSRFALSIHPFGKEKDGLDLVKYDLLSKLDDLAEIVRQER